MDPTLLARLALDGVAERFITVTHPNSIADVERRIADLRAACDALLAYGESIPAMT